VSRVEWSRRAADEVESVISIMLCRENPNSIRIRPSQGDRGVDIYTPEDDGWTVYQVKSFTGSLTASRKKQIRKSWDAFQLFVAERSLAVRSWTLVRPENPTWQDEQWLASLTEGSVFPCRWRGLDFCDRLAADHPSVIDYYFDDGRDRLATTLEKFLKIANVGANKQLSTEPATSNETLVAIHSAVNSLDPHYRYDFSVRAASGLSEFQETKDPTLVAEISRWDGEREIVFRIHSRYQGATEDRPIPGSFKFAFGPDSQQAAAVQDFLDYGLPIHNADAVDLTVDLPGGFGTEGQAGLVRLGPASGASTSTQDLRLAVYGQGDDRQELAGADLKMDAATRGLRGEKFAVSGHEEHGVFQVVFRVSPEDNSMNMKVTTNPLTGLTPADVVPALALLIALAPPNRFVLSVRNGPILLPLAPVMERVIEGLEPSLRACEDLATIQRHSLAAVRVPDLLHTTLEQAQEWNSAARLLTGEALDATWNSVELQGGPEQLEAFDLTQDSFTIGSPVPLKVNVGGTVIDLGFQFVQLMAARVDTENLSVDGRPPDVVRLVPAGDDRAVATWLGSGPPSAPEARS
jgi:hypothetical protein